MTKEEFIHNVMPMKNKLFGYAINLLKNREEAKDVVQDTLVKIWTSNKEIKEYTNIESWGMTLVRNRCLDLFKRKDRNNTTLDLHFGISSDQPTPTDQLETNDRLRKVKKIIDNLPEIQREIIYLRDFHEKSYKEITEIIDLDMNKVKVYLHRARKTIKEKMIKIDQYGMQSI